MANQKGIITLDGTLEGINFYIRKGKPVARKAGGGFTARAIKSKPSMIRVRENNSEFGHCSKVKKQLRLALLPFLQLHNDTSLHGRMMRMLQEVKNCDPISERGQRTVYKGLQTTMGLKLFTDFAFTPACNIQNILQCDYSYNPTDFTLTFDLLDINKVKFPSSSTHIEIQFGVLAFDFGTLTYTLHQSVPQLLSKSTTNTTFHFTPATTPDTSMTLFAFSGVRFYQEISGELYALKGDGMVGVKCFGVLP
jgi:hypothetical protein